MSGAKEPQEYRIFVGGLSWEVTERQLEDAFSRFGKIIDSQIMMERDTGRPRGFGFLTFADRRGMEDAIREMHGRELGDRAISVNKAQPKMGGDDAGQRYSAGYPSGGRGSYGGDRSSGPDECFKCGRPGHWARDCPSAGGGRVGGHLSSVSRFAGSGGRGDRFGDRYGERDRFVDDRYDGGRYGGDRYEIRETKYGSRDYVTDRYPPSSDRFVGDRYGDSDRYPTNGYGKERLYERDAGPRRSSERYGGGGPARYEGKGYRDRAGPYDRPRRAGQPSSFDRY
ncbi:glycine-rich RNA-binding protein RZ1C isoform X1 [Apium graveolens]|uniref:glycine-rich RNA-binding protein RZ1C isoform X1 n=2 Tax=Apium graveolens TaxID=4045 RepID=UPI003D7ABF69